MICPKCSHQQNEANRECEKCGIIFAKYYAALSSKLGAEKNGIRPSSPIDDKPRMALGELFFYTKAEDIRIFFYARLVGFLIIFVWGVKFIFSPMESNYAGKSVMHLINLPFHEAGHIILRPCGSFMTSLGGTLGQLMMPLVCFFVLLLKTRDTFGASVTLWWFGQNYFDIAPYVNDARSLSLPLLGGNVGHSSPYGFHDWEYLLTESGLLHYDHFIAKLCLAIGAIIFLASFAWGGFLLLKQYKSFG